MELIEMFAGWKWRFSRSLEVAVVAAAIVGNRIPLNEEAVDVEVRLRAFPLYDKGGES